MGAAVVALTAGEAAAQRSPVVFMDFAAFAVEPTGDFGRLVDDGWGGEIGARVRMDPYGVASLRMDFGFINYGHEEIRFCSVSCRVREELHTYNNIFFFGVGPEISPPLGWVRPYLGAQVGLGYFFTTSHYDRDGNYDDGYHGGEPNSTNFDDVAFQWRGRGGLQLQVAGGRSPVYLDFGAEYHDNAVVDYLIEGGLEDRPDGSVVAYPNRSDVSLWTVRFGVSIGIGGGDRHRRHGN